ncbi:MAG TPA: rod shape-determining protein MreC [Syntrophomonadaceae bacterium]|nr:rod shape-determining protein MreC [Syntrophomonadaceae bacterium]HQE22905.1 rod shape-determining protein MreC [Syntrophomonadaceae bacterium]
MLGNKWFWLVFLVVIGALITMNQTSLPREDITMLEKVVHGVYTPLQNGVNNIRGHWGNLGDLLSDKRAMQSRIQELEQRNAQMAIDNQALREYEAQAKRLQNILQFKEDNLDIYDLQVAAIIARSPNNWHKTVLINVGANAGIEPGMPVIHPDGLVGRISRVNSDSAQVSLITDREMAVGVILQRSRETNGIVEGTGSSHLLRMNNIPYYSSIEENDRVITSGLSANYPKGIDVGIVSKVNREPSGLLLSAEVKPAVDFDRLEEVLVITNYHPPIVEDDEEMGE